MERAELRNRIATFGAERRIRWEIIGLAVISGAVALATAMAGALWSNFLTRMAAATIPWTGVVAVAFARLVPHTRRSLRVSEGGLEVLDRNRSVKRVAWREISRVRFGRGGFYWRLDLWRVGDGAAIPLYLWYESTAQLVHSISANTPHLVSNDPEYAGESVGWYVHFEDSVRLAGILLAGALFVLVVGDDAEVAFIFVSFAITLFVLLGLLKLLLLPSMVKAVRIGSTEIEIQRFVVPWFDVRVRYPDIADMEIDVETTRGGLRAHIPVIRLRTTQGKTILIPSEVCREFVVCYQRIFDLRAAAS